MKNGDRELFLKSLNEIIEEYKGLLTDNYVKDLLREKFTKATESQLNKKVDKHRDKICKQLDKLVEILETFTDYDINKYKSYFDKQSSKEVKFKNLLLLKNDIVGI